MATKPWAIGLVLFSTLITSTAQIFYKFGANKIVFSAAGIWGLFTNWQLILGVVLYCIAAVMLIISLKHGDLSVLYPIIAMSYVWVAFMSMYILHEQMNVLKWGGIAVIILGVSLIGVGSREGSVAV